MRGMKNGVILLLMGLAVLGARDARGDLLYRVDFSQSEYEVQEDETFAVEVHFDSDRSLPGWQTFAEGLFSFGVKLHIPSSDGALGGTEDIVIAGPIGHGFFSTTPPELQYGLVGGENVAMAEGSVGIDGSAYLGSHLVTFNVSNQAPVGSTYELSLAYWSSIPSGTGDSMMRFDLDNPESAKILPETIEYGSATVTVVPEPASWAMLAAGLVAWRRRRA